VPIFNDPAKLDDGTMWPRACAHTELTAADCQQRSKSDPLAAVEI